MNGHDDVGVRVTLGCDYPSRLYGLQDCLGKYTDAYSDRVHLLSSWLEVGSRALSLIVDPDGWSFQFVPSKHIWRERRFHEVAGLVARAFCLGVNAYPDEPNLWLHWSTEIWTTKPSGMRIRLSDGPRSLLYPTELNALMHRLPASPQADTLALGEMTIRPISRLRPERSSTPEYAKAIVMAFIAGAGSGLTPASSPSWRWPAS